MLKGLWQGLKDFWAAWTRLVKKVGNFQARVLLTLMYAVLVLPFGVVVRLFGDPLRIKHRPTRWLDREDEPITLEWAHRQ